MLYHLPVSPPIHSNLETILSRSCSLNWSAQPRQPLDEILPQDLELARTRLSNIPSFSDLTEKCVAGIDTFVTQSLRLAYASFSDLQIVVDRDFDALSLSLRAHSIVLDPNVLECLNEFCKLSERVMINTYPIDPLNMGLMILIPLQALQ